MWAALGALAPPVGVGLIFWFVIRSIMHADRAERASLAEAERQERLHREMLQDASDGHPQ